MHILQTANHRKRILKVSARTSRLLWCKDLKYHLLHYHCRRETFHWKLNAEKHHRNITFCSVVWQHLLLTWVQTFDDRGCVYEISSTQDAHEVRVELSNLNPGRPVHGERMEQESCVEDKKKQVKIMCGGSRGGWGLQGSFTARQTIWKRALFVRLR